MRATRWLPAVAALVALTAIGKPPTLDEESYLWLGTHLNPLRPYDWTRVWPPYGDDGFIYAHPPLHLLWMWLCTRVTDVVPVLRVIDGLPWVLLYAWSTALLAQRACRHPSLAAALWLTSSTVVLGLQDDLMIDLPAVALGTLALAAYREGLARAPRPSRSEGRGEPDEPSSESDARRWFLLSGLALGLGVATKYPVGLVGIALAVHMSRYRWRWEVLGLAAGIVALDEGWLWMAYGRLHAWEVWARKDEIAAGPVEGRALGVFARLALLPLPFALLRADPASTSAGAGVGLLAFALGRPAGLSPLETTTLVAMAVVGGMGVGRATKVVFVRHSRRRKGDRGDSLLLGAMIVVTVVGVVAVHNYASARYLLPAAAPLAIVVTRAAEEVEGGKWLARLSILFSGLAAVAIATADGRYAAASAEVARQVIRDTPVEPDRPPRFAGEWSARWRFESAGWQRYRPDEVLPPGTVVAVMDNASPGALAPDQLEATRHVESFDDFPVRVNDVKAGVSLYAETIGPLPVGWRRAPVEGAMIYVVRAPKR